MKKFHISSPVRWLTRLAGLGSVSFMSFDAAISRVPRPFDPDRAADFAPRLGWAPAATRSLIDGAVGCAPHLADLVAAEAAWLEGALTGSPETALERELASIAPGGFEATGRHLRHVKRRVALLVALADLGGVWPLEQVTGALTRLADLATDAAIKTALAPALARGKLPDHGEDALDDAAGLVALAMGKMGAAELNYSSDIDLICLFDDRRFEGADLGEARSVFVATVRRAMALLSDRTSEGYVFRTDLRLRPDPSVTPVALSVSAAERYYEGLGRTWERAAYIKARPAAGAIAVGAAFLHEIAPFIWRRHLDYATVEDAHGIRMKIRAQTGQGPATLDGRNLKLGPGGIREIEFFTQTRQLIAGGRDATLRPRGTKAALAQLAERGWVRPSDAETLARDYTRLRELEHRLQMLRDAQTHSLPQAAEDWDRLAAFAGARDAAALRAELLALFDRVHAKTEDFFAPRRATPPEPPLPTEAERIVARWQAYPALRSERARAIFARLRPRLLQGFERAARPEEAVAQFDTFLRGLPAGVQVFSLFEANPQLVDLMVDISSTAPALARYLADHPGVLDAVIGGDFFADWPGRATLEADLRAALAAPGLDHERRLDAARRWMKDWHFRIGVHHLRGLISPARAASQYSDLAEATVAALWETACTEVGRKHGPLPGRGAVVLGMGSLGARQLTAASDLDLIVIYDADEGAESTGRKPLPARSYYARLTKALVTALSTQTAAGTLYRVDMRLRPSGRQGPAATRWSAFQSYQHTEAWTWEHLALTRARIVTGDTALAAQVERFRTALIASPRDSRAVRADLANMRRRLAAAKPQAGPWDVANGPGGQQDIELFAQTLALLSGCPARRMTRQLAEADGVIRAEQRTALESAWRCFAAVKGVSRLLAGEVLDPDAIGHGGRTMLLRDADAATPAELSATLAGQRSQAAAIIDQALADVGETEPGHTASK